MTKPIYFQPEASGSQADHKNDSAFFPALDTMPQVFFDGSEDKATQKDQKLELL